MAQAKQRANITHLGDRIRQFRMSRHMSLGDLAGKVDTSRSFLSQVEQGKTMPSVTTLKSIADALDVTVGALIDDPEESAGPVVHANERPRIEHLQSGITLESLTHRDVHKVMQPLFGRLEPGASTGYGGHVHQGQECVVVLKGRLDVEVDGTNHTLGEGDSIYFDSSRPHRFVNPGEKETLVIWVASPPTF